MSNSLNSYTIRRRSVRVLDGRYGYVRHMALVVLQKHINVQFEMMLHSIDYCISIDMNSEPFKGLFTWSYKEFLQHRNNSNKLARDMILLQNSHQLDILKLHHDLSETLRFINLLFDTVFLTMSDAKFDINKKLWEPLRDLQELVKMEENDHQVMKDTTNTLMLIYKRVMPTLTFAEHRRLKRSVDLMNNTIVVNNAELRYNLKWQEAQVAQAELKTQSDLKELKAFIERQKQFSFFEEDCGDTIVEVIYNNAEKYRDMLERFEHEFHVKNDEWTTTVRAKQLQVDKMLQKMSFYKEQSEWFEDEIKRIEIAIQNGQAERQAYHKEQEELRRIAARTEHIHHARKYHSSKDHKVKAHLSQVSYVHSGLHVPSEYSSFTMHPAQANKLEEKLEIKRQSAASVEADAMRAEENKPQVRIHEAASTIHRISDISYMHDDEDMQEHGSKRNLKRKKAAHKGIAKQHSGQMHGDEDGVESQKSPLHAKRSLHHKSSVHHATHKNTTHKRKTKKHASQEHIGSSEESLRSHPSSASNIHMSRSQKSLYEQQSSHSNRNKTNSEE